MPADKAAFLAAPAPSDREILSVQPNSETRTHGRRRHRQTRQMPLAAPHPACSLPDSATRFRPLRRVSLSSPSEPSQKVGRTPPSAPDPLVRLYDLTKN